MNDAYIESFFQTFKDFYQRASSPAENNSVCINLGDRVAIINFSHQQIKDRMMRSMAHLIIPDSAPSDPDLTLYCFDDLQAGNTSVSSSFTWSASDLGVQGLITSYTSERYQTAYQHGAGAIMMYDQDTKEGIYW